MFFSLSVFYKIKDKVYGSGVGLDIVGRGFGCLCQGVGVVDKVVHHGGKILCVVDFKATAEGDEVASLAKSLVVRPDDDRHTVDCCLRHIVDAPVEETTIERDG